jgi:hypothetical protein
MFDPDGSAGTPSINVLKQLEHMGGPVLAPNVEAFGHLHNMLFGFHISLGTGKYKIELARVPALEDRKNETHSNGNPLHDRGIRFPTVNAMLLLPSMDVEAGLPLVNFPSVDASFPLIAQTNGATLVAAGSPVLETTSQWPLSWCDAISSSQAFANLLASVCFIAWS